MATSYRKALIHFASLAEGETLDDHARWIAQVMRADGIAVDWSVDRQRFEVWREP